MPTLPGRYVPAHPPLDPLYGSDGNWSTRKNVIMTKDGNMECILDSNPCKCVCVANFAVKEYKKSDFVPCSTN